MGERTQQSFFSESELSNNKYEYTFINFSDFIQEK